MKAPDFISRGARPVREYSRCRKLVSGRENESVYSGERTLPPPGLFGRAGLPAAVAQGRGGLGSLFLCFPGTKLRVTCVPLFNVPYGYLKGTTYDLAFRGPGNRRCGKKPIRPAEILSQVGSLGGAL